MGERASDRITSSNSAIAPADRRLLVEEQRADEMGVRICRPHRDRAVDLFDRQADIFVGPPVK